MPQAGFTPIQTYNSPTAGHIPVNTDLYAGELAINTTDEKLYFKNTGGTVKLLASTAVFTTTGSGSYVLATSPTITGHPTIEGVTSTGATGTGKFVFDSAPTITGHPTIEGVTSTGATGTGKFVFDSSPTLSGVTLSDGTANGVVYLNSSKVLTSGSGLVFDGTNFGIGVNVDGPIYMGVHNTNTSGSPTAIVSIDSYKVGTKAAVEFGDTTYYTGYISTDRTNGMIFAVGNALTHLASGEQMRLTSTGLGIGTSNPGSKLDVVVSGGAQQLRLGSAGNSLFRTRWIDSTTGLGLESLNSNETSYYPLGITGLVLRLNTGDGSTKATLDSSGNLGLGVVPSAWRSTAKALQIGGGVTASIWTTASGVLQLGNNVYTNTSGYDAYISSDYATTYAQSSGGHYWYKAPSGTAGNAISFTQAMTLDASGNLLVGATSGSYKITCNGQPGANGYTAWTNYSDERLKENIVDFVSEPVLNKICELRPVSFNYNDKTGFDEETRQRTVSGFIAQEMQQVFPDMVGKTIIGEEEYLDTNLSNLTLYLVKAIQELTARIEKLENKI